MTAATLDRQTAVTVVVVDWLPRYGRHAHYFAEVGVIAVSWALCESGRVEAVLEECGVVARNPEPHKPVTLHPTCALCGRSDPPPRGKRPTVNDLGLLQRR